jgi:hypothetical protein
MMSKRRYIITAVLGLALMSAGVVVNVTHSVKGLGTLLLFCGVIINTICVFKQPRSSLSNSQAAGQHRHQRDHDEPSPRGTHHQDEPPS